MTELLITLCVVLALGIAGSFVLWRLLVGPDPKEAKLSGTEISLSIKRPFYVTGRLDELWEDSDGQLTIKDFKNRPRHRVYDDDILQISIYAWMLRRTARYKKCNINAYGYIGFPTSRTTAPVYKRVRLLSDAQIDAIVTAAFSKARSPEFLGPTLCYRCSNCGHFSKCEEDGLQLVEAIK